MWLSVVSVMGTGALRRKVRHDREGCGTPAGGLSALADMCEGEEGRLETLEHRSGQRKVSRQQQQRMWRERRYTFIGSVYGPRG